MKKGTCIKCSGANVYTNARLTPRGERTFMAGDDSGKMSRRLFIEVVVCADCGYFEEYVIPQDLSDEKKMERLKSSWKKINP